MQNSASRFKSKFALLMVLLLVATLFTMATPIESYALETVKCTAKVNSDKGNDVMGATNTRVTWEVQSDETESLMGLSITFPEGTTFSTEDVKVTMLTGSDLMTRNTIDATVVQDGQTISMTFPEASEAGAYFRVEIYDVFFPGDGGEMAFTGTYTLADGSVHQINDIPSITVTGISAAEQFSNYLAEQDWVKAWNSVKFLHMFLDPTILVTSFPVVFNGFLMAIAVVAVSFPLAIPFGLLLALMRISKHKVLRGIATLYVNIVRGTPLFLQIYIAFFGLPLAGIQIPDFPLGVIVLAMNSCAYQCEIIRAGIQSIPKGQSEAARSLGMNGFQTMVYVIIPQTIRRILPTMTNEFILLYKDTSMLAAVGVMEVVMYAKTIVAATGSITPYIVAACFYLIITLPLAKIVGNFEKKLAGKDTGNTKKNNKKRSRNSFGSKDAAHVDDGLLSSDENEDFGITPEQGSSL
ncbi:MAG: amino acid ABC transporter permease [Coriobacteriales bacterium]